MQKFTFYLYAAEGKTSTLVVTGDRLVPRESTYEVGSRGTIEAIVSARDVKYVLREPVNPEPTAGGSRLAKNAIITTPALAGELGDVEAIRESFTIDGAEFPWFIDIRGPFVEWAEADDELDTIWVPIVVERPHGAVRPADAKSLPELVAELPSKLEAQLAMQEAAIARRRATTGTGRTLDEALDDYEEKLTDESFKGDGSAIHLQQGEYDLNDPRRAPIRDEPQA